MKKRIFIVLAVAVFGFMSVETFDSIQAAMVAFSERDHEYADWDDDDNG